MYINCFGSDIGNGIVGLLIIVLVGICDLIVTPLLFWRSTPSEDGKTAIINPAVIIVRGSAWFLWVAVSALLIYFWQGMALALLITHWVCTLAYYLLRDEDSRDYAWYDLRGTIWIGCFAILGVICVVLRTYSPVTTSVETYPLDSYQYKESITYETIFLNQNRMSHHAVISYTSADGEHAGEVEVNENVILVANSENPRVEITTCHRSLVDHITIIPVTLNEETALVKTIFYLPDDDFIQSTLPTDE